MGKKKMSLMTHQLKILAQTKYSDCVAYFADMGLGKTFIGSEKVKQVNNNTNLILCQKSKVTDWYNHFKDYYEEYTVIDCTKEKNLLEINKITNKKVLIINYDLIFRREFFLTLKDFTLLLDESSIIQNEKSKRAKFILKLNPKNVILLSGTPVSGKYENLYSQCKLLGWNITKELYDKQYVNYKSIDVGGYIYKVVDKNNPYKNVERLKQKLREHGAVFLKTEECFDLPKQNFVRINIKKTKDYEKFLKDSIVKVNKDVLVGDTNLVKRIYLRKLCGEYNKEKLQAFEDLISSTQDRLLVFYNFNNELEILKNIAIKLEKPISEFNGEVKNLSNYENEENSVTFIQYQAGSMGLNLQKANKIIYFTLTETSELFEQSKKRIHRIGQEKTCFYYLLICENSIEESILKSLEIKKDFTDDLFKFSKE